MASIGKWCWPGAFLVLSLLDWRLTRALLEESCGAGYELNPVAASVLEGYGWAGLGYYKAGCTAVVAVAALWIARSRPRLGRFVFAGAAALLLVVTSYSLSTCRSPGFQMLRQLHDRAQSLDRRCLETQQYARVSHRLIVRLAVGETSLLSATEELSQQVPLYSYDPIRALRGIHPGLSDRACLSASLIRGVAVTLQDDPPRVQERLQGLRREFEAHYSVPLPPFAWLESIEVAVQPFNWPLPPSAE